MTITQEVKRKAKNKNKVLKSAKKLLDARDDIIGFFLKKEPFRIKIMYLKQKKKKNQKKNQKKTSQKK